MVAIQEDLRRQVEHEPSIVTSYRESIAHAAAVPDSEVVVHIHPPLTPAKLDLLRWAKRTGRESVLEPTEASPFELTIYRIRVGDGRGAIMVRTGGDGAVCDGACW